MTSSETTLSEVAELCGVRLSAVTNWRSRFDDFPDPVGSRGNQLLFGSDDVRAWLQLHEKLPAAGAASGAGSAAVSPEQARQEFALSAAALLERFRPGRLAELKPRFPELWEVPGFAGAAEVRTETLRQAAERFGGANPSDAARQVRRVFRSQVDRGRFTDSPDLARLMVAVVPVAGRLEDPCCGTGELLAEAARRSTEAGVEVVARGQDLDPLLAAGAECLLAAAGLDARMARANVLDASAHPEPAEAPANGLVILANPPLEQRLPADGIDRTDPRWVVEVPKTFPDAWVQHCVSRLPASGEATACVVVPMAWLGGKSAASRRVRTALLRQGLVEAVIAVPLPRVDSRIRAAGVVLLRRRPPSDRSVLMVDLVSGDRPSNRWGAIPESLIAQVAAHVGEFRSTGGLAGPSEFAVVAGLAEIEAAGGTIQPARYQRVSEQDLRRANVLGGLKPTRTRSGTAFEPESSTEFVTQAEQLAGQVAARLAELGEVGRYVDAMVAAVPTPEGDGATNRTVKDAVAAGELELFAGRSIAGALDGAPDGVTSPFVVLSVSGADFGAVEVVPDLATVDTTRRIVVLRPLTVAAEFLAAWMSSGPIQERLERRAQGSARGGRSVPTSAVLDLPANFPDNDTQARLSGAWKALARLGEIAALLDSGLSHLKLQLAEPFVASAEDPPRPRN